MWFFSGYNQFLAKLVHKIHDFLFACLGGFLEAVDVVAKKGRVQPHQPCKFGYIDFLVCQEKVLQGARFSVVILKTLETNVFVQLAPMDAAHAKGVLAAFFITCLTKLPQATIETDEERTYFLIDIPCHPKFIAERVVLNEDFKKDFIKENRKQITERQEDILFMIAEDGTMTSQKISQKTGVTQRTILNDLNKLQSMGIIAREGGRKTGYWVVVTK